MRRPRRKIVPGMDSGVKLDMQSLKSLEKKSMKASMKYDDYVKARNKQYLDPKLEKYRIKESTKATGNCILQAFIKAAKENCLQGKYLEISTALIAHYVDASRRTIRRHIKKLIDAGIIIEKQDNPSCTHNNNYLIRLADWLIDELCEVVEQVNRAAHEVQECSEQNIEDINHTPSRSEHKIERLIHEALNHIGNYKEEETKDVPKSFRAHLKREFYGTG